MDFSFCVIWVFSVEGEAWVWDTYDLTWFQGFLYQLLGGRVFGVILGFGALNGWCLGFFIILTARGFLHVLVACFSMVVQEAGVFFIFFFSHFFFGTVRGFYFFFWCMCVC